MIGHFFAAASRQSLAQLSAQMLDLCGQRCDNSFGFLAAEFTSIAERMRRSTNVAVKIYFEPAIKSLCQWPVMARSSTAAGRSQIEIPTLI